MAITSFIDCMHTRDMLFSMLPDKDRLACCTGHSSGTVRIIAPTCPRNVSCVVVSHLFQAKKNKTIVIHYAFLGELCIAVRDVIITIKTLTHYPTILSSTQYKAYKAL